MFRTPLRMFLTAFVAVAALVGGVVAFAATSHPVAAPRVVAQLGAAEHEAADPDAHEATDGDSGEEGGDDGGPVAPADYLTQKFTSNSDVTPAQVRQAQAQAQ